MPPEGTLPAVETNPADPASVTFSVSAAGTDSGTTIQAPDVVTQSQDTPVDDDASGEKVSKDEHVKKQQEEAEHEEDCQPVVGYAQMLEDKDLERKAAQSLSTTTEV